MFLWHRIREDMQNFRKELPILKTDKHIAYLIMHSFLPVCGSISNAGCVLEFSLKVFLGVFFHLYSQDKSFCNSLSLLGCYMNGSQVNCGIKKRREQRSFWHICGIIWGVLEWTLLKSQVKFCTKSLLVLFFFFSFENFNDCFYFTKGYRYIWIVNWILI